jgi:hypothetical protein
MRKSQCVCEREGPRERERETNSVRERQPFGEVKALVSEPDNREADHGAEESVEEEQGEGGAHPDARHHIRPHEHPHHLPFITFIFFCRQLRA